MANTPIIKNNVLLRTSPTTMHTNYGKPITAKPICIITNSKTFFKNLTYIFDNCMKSEFEPFNIILNINYDICNK